MINVILQFIELELVNINVSAKFYQNIINGLRVKFHCFQNLNLGKPRPIPNVIWLPPGLHHVNINVYAKFHHNIPLSSRDRAIFTFSEFGARQSLDQRKMSFRNLFGQILLISMYTQKFIKIFHSVQKIGLFSIFQNLALGKAPTKINVISHLLD